MIKDSSEVGFQITLESRISNHTEVGFKSLSFRRKDEKIYSIYFLEKPFFWSSNRIFIVIEAKLHYFLH